MKMKLNNMFVIGAVIIFAIIVSVLFIKKPIVVVPTDTSGRLTEIKDGKYSGKCNNITGTVQQITADDCITNCLTDSSCKGYEFSQNMISSIGGLDPSGIGKCTTYTTTPTSAKKAANTTCYGKI
jgi:hypothetical protein